VFVFAPHIICTHSRPFLKKVSAILTGVHYGKPPHGETKPCCSAAEQKVAFQVHCKVALAFKLPLVITMEASKDLHETAVGDVQAWLAECCIPEEYKLYFASWSGTSVSATKLLKRYKNCMLGLNGSLLFRANEHLREVAFDLPLTRLVLESDAPNNAPSESVLPHSSWTVLAVAQAVASQKKCNDVTLVLAETNKNAASFFNATLWKEEEEVEAGGGEKEGGGRVGEADLNLKEMAEYLEEVEGGDEED
jgi:Tat protein secretion system quality control protein TatD with DNase activity